MKKMVAVFLISLALAWDKWTAAQGPPVSVGIVQEPAKLKTFRRTPEGNWQTTIKDASGEEREFVYVPPTKVRPQVTVEMDLLQNSGDLRVQYAYSIANGAEASQEVAALFFRNVRQSLVKMTPEGWNQLTPPTPGNLTFSGPLLNGGGGIRPDARVALTLESASLPGVMLVQAMGATDDRGAVRIPAGLSETQHEELYSISREGTVSTAAIGPVIPAGIGEPELTFGIVLTRVVAHYSAELRKHNHPAAGEIAAVLASLDRLLAGGSEPTFDSTAVRSGLDRLIQLARRPAVTAWHDDLSEGLRISAEALASGALPLRGMPGEK